MNREELLVSSIKRTIEMCSWKSAIFYSSELLEINPMSVEGAFGQSLSLYCQGKLAELEIFMRSLPMELQTNEQIIILRCKGLEKTKDYEKICSLLGGDLNLVPVSLPVINIDDLDKHPRLKAIRENAMFNAAHSDDRILLPQQDGKDPMRPSEIIKRITEAMMKRKPELVEDFTLKADRTTKTDALVLTACGCSCWLDQRIEEGDALFMKAIDEDPDCEIAWLCLLMSLIESSAWDQGISTIRQVIRRFPESESVWMFAMSLHLKNGSTTLAQPWICRSDIDIPFVKHERGVSALLDGDYEDAARDFEEVLATSTDNDLLFAASINAGHCFRKDGKYQEAIKHYENALSYDMKQDEVLASIGFTFHLQKDIDSAIIFYNRCLSINPVHPFATKMMDMALQSHV